MENDLFALLGGPVTELGFAQKVTAWEEDREANAEALDLALRYAAWATHSAAGQARWADAVLFRVPHKTDPQHLVPVETESGAASPC